MILEATRGHIRFQFEERTGTIESEILVPHDLGDSGRVVYRDTFQRWDPPFDNEVVDEETKDKILKELQLERARGNGVLEVRRNWGDWQEEEK
jgi:hypothetical protein